MVQQYFILLASKVKLSIYRYIQIQIRQPSIPGPMIHKQLKQLRELVAQVQKNQRPFSEVYSKIDRIVHLIDTDSDQDSPTLHPSAFIKPIQGLLSTYQSSVQKLKQQQQKIIYSSKKSHSGVSPQKTTEVEPNKYRFEPKENIPVSNISENTTTGYRRKIQSVQDQALQSRSNSHTSKHVQGDCAKIMENSRLRMNPGQRKNREAVNSNDIEAKNGKHKTIGELDAEIVMLTNQIRNILR